MPTNKPKSSKKSATARANGAKSHGPTTAAGLARSSQNALRHGLATRAAALPTVSVVLDDESPADFQRLLDSYLDQFAPTSPIEVELIETMVSARWRLRRLANIETTLLANEMETTVNDIHQFFADVDREPNVEDHLAYAFKQLASDASLHLLLRYEGTLSRSYARALKHLQQLQTLRNRPQPNEPKKGLPAEPSADLALRASVPDLPASSLAANPTLSPLPSNKVDDEAHPAPKSLPPEPSGDRVLQDLPQRLFSSEKH
jgi:hypothetical protein